MSREIKLEKTNDDFKKGFKVATQMILRWCKDSKTKKITDLISIIEASNKLQELMESKE